MISHETNSLTVEPIISYPRKAESGKTYLLSIDLRPLMNANVKWPLKGEECVIYCLLNSAPLFSNQALGEPAVVVHRYGGSYGPATFLLKAANVDKEMVGTIRITLVNEWGIPLIELPLKDIHITTQEMETSPEFFLEKMPSAPESPQQLLDSENSEQYSDIYADNVESTDSAVPLTTPRNIIGYPPPTNPKTIQQREQIVEQVYSKLTQPDITALVLTGIGGVGKSTLAALVYSYAEEQRLANKGPFSAEALWLSIDDTITMTDLGETLCSALGQPLPDFGRLDPQRQAMALFNTMNATSKARLIILDQFESLLDWQTGQALTNRLGIGDWLDILNSRSCTCRLLMTSRNRPQGTRRIPQTYLQEYLVPGMSIMEGIDLLQKQGVTGTQAELLAAVQRCEGHALSLTLLAALLRNNSLSLTTLFDDPEYAQLWRADIDRSLLDYIYTRQLSEIQRELLQAFSLYREAVPLAAAEVLIDVNSRVQRREIQSALNVLLSQQLLQAVGDGLYKLHAIVASYVHDHFDESSDEANKRAILAAHARAAQYYLQQASKSCPPREKRRGIKDVQPLIEAIWQLFRAEQWQEAYDLMEQEGIFADLNRWGGNAILLQLYELLLSQNEWQLSHSQSVLIYNDLGVVIDELGRKQEAIDYFQRALAISREIGDRRGESLALNNLGRVYDDLGQKQEAIDYFQRALAINREIGDRRGEGSALNNLGRVYDDLGQKQEAIQYSQQALAINREIGDRRGEAVSFNNLGLLYDELGQKQEAIRYSQQALAINREIGDRAGEGRALNNLGRVYDDLGQKQEAFEYFQQALYIYREIGNRSGEGISLFNIGTLFSALRHYEDALACFLLARNIFEEVLSPIRDNVQEWIDNLQEEVGEQQFAELLAKVEPQEFQLVEQALRKEKL